MVQCRVCGPGLGSIDWGGFGSQALVSQFTSLSVSPFPGRASGKRDDIVSISISVLCDKEMAGGGGRAGYMKRMNMELDTSSPRELRHHCHSQSGF